MALRRLVAIVGRGQAAVVSGSLLLPMACNSGSVAPCSDPVQVVLAPADTTLSLGSSFAASVRLTVCGESKSASDVIAWRSDDATVAVVDAGGQVTGTGVGATRIRATSEHYGPLGSIELFVYNSVNPTSAEARAELRYYVERVKRADSRQYRTTDDLGHTMDGLKIIANPAASGFIGVYQTYRAGTFDAHLATSGDLLHWTWRTVIDRSAAQPTIKAAGAGFVVVTETDGDNHLRFYYYDSWQALLNASPSQTFDAPRTLSPCAEGTPNIYAGDRTHVEVGFHYWSQCDVGRQARGVTDWSSWSAAPEPALDNAIIAYGIAGVGDRDGPITFRGYQFAVIEGEGVRNQWDSWRVFLYDYQTHTADQLNIQTDAGSISFGNPTIEQVQIGARQALVMTLFVFLDGSRADENGSLVYYRGLP